LTTGEQAEGDGIGITLAFIGITLMPTFGHPTTLPPSRSVLIELAFHLPSAERDRAAFRHSCERSWR
jgi:hypothetical protein